MLDQRNTQVVAESEGEIARRLEAERARLRREAGLIQLQPFQRPKEKAFTAEERGRVTIFSAG